MSSSEPALEELEELIRLGVRTMLEVNLALRPGERFLVLTDTPTRDDWTRGDPRDIRDLCQRALLARATAAVAAALYPESPVRVVAFPATGRAGAEPPPGVAAALAEADVAVILTTYSLSHTAARMAACAAGTRLASMPGFLAAMFAADGPLAVDCAAMARETALLAHAIDSAGCIDICTDEGTALTLSLCGRPGLEGPIFFHEPGSWGNLPSGEAYAVPLEGTAEGTLVVPAGWFPRLVEPLRLHLASGELVSVEGGGDVGRWLREITGVGTSAHRERRNCAELGLGTNPRARRCDSILEGEKIRGTVHIALGDNIHMGGTVTADFHQDFVIPRPTLRADGRAVLLAGRIAVATS